MEATGAFANQRQNRKASEAGSVVRQPVLCVKFRWSECAGLVPLPVDARHGVDGFPPPRQERRDLAKAAVDRHTLQGMHMPLNAQDDALQQVLCGAVQLAWWTVCSRAGLSTTGSGGLCSAAPAQL